MDASRLNCRTRDLFGAPLLCLVTDRRLAPGNTLIDRVARAVIGGVAMVHLREKDLPTSSLVALARGIRARCPRTVLVINGDVTAAAQAGADGVHLPEDSQSVAAARRHLAEGEGSPASHPVLVGRSVHSVEAGLKAEDAGADYLIVGTIFESRSKPGKSPEGLVLLETMALHVGVPVLGIGGINAANVHLVMAAGACGAAVISSILAEPDPESAAAGIQESMCRAGGLKPPPVNVVGFHPPERGEGHSS